MVEKWVTLLSTPGCLIVLFVVVGPLSIPYFWLYRERHRTVIDFDGTESEKVALAEYRVALSRESLWARLLFCTGIRGPSDNRAAADQAMTEVWDRYNARVHGDGERSATD